MTSRSFVVLASLAALLGCHNTDLPDIAALGGDGGSTGGVGPSLALVGPSNPKLSLSSVLSFDVNDVDGVSSVSLNCGAYPLASWQSPPFQAAIDLTPCRAFATPEPGKPGFLTVTLSLVANDQLGNQSRLDFPVEIDATTAVLSTDLGQTLAPGEPVDFSVTSDRPLKAPPVVFVGQVQAEVTPDPAQANHFFVHLDLAPSTSTDGGTAVDDTPLAVTLSAIALNGNASQLALAVRVTRVLWTQALGVSIPLGSSNPAPVATGAGLNFVSDEFNGIGGSLDRRDGTQHLFNADGGIPFAIPRGLSGTGAFTWDNGTSASFVDLSSGQASTPVTIPTGLFSALPFDDGVVGLTTSGCPGASTVTYAAPGKTTQQQQYDAGTGSATSHVSGPAYLLANVLDCNSASSGWLLDVPSTGQSLFEISDPKNPTCAPYSSFNVVSGTDGTFALDLGCSNGTDVDAFLIDSSGNHVGSYFAPTAGPGTGDSPVGMDVDHRLITTTSNPGPGLLFKAWPADGGSPATYQTLTAATLQPPVIARPDGGIDVLLTSQLASGGGVVTMLRLGTDLQPLWTYRYPLVLGNLSPSNLPALAAAPDGGPVYLIDQANSVVTALQR